MIKTYFKKACIIAMCISLLLSSTSIVHAKETGWEEKDGRWYYYYADGTTPVGEVTIDGTGYIFTAEGYVLDKNETLDLIDSAQSGYGVKPIGDYEPSPEIVQKIESELSSIYGTGADVGFMLIDPILKKGLTSNADTEFFSASSIKGIYVAGLVYSNPTVLTTDYNTINSIITYSDNDAYSSLFNKYGNASHISWFEMSHVDTSHGSWSYTNYSSRMLAKLWTSNMFYFYTNSTGYQLGQMYQNPNASAIHATLGGTYKTQTKAGWVNEPPRYISTTDGGIVYKGNGNHPIIMAINSNYPCNQDILNGLVSALNEASDEIMNQGLSLRESEKSEDTENPLDTDETIPDQKDETAPAAPVYTWKCNSTGWWLEEADGSYPHSTWMKMDGYWYYFGEDGYMASNEWIDGYYLSINGAWDYEPTGSWGLNSKGWYYMDTSGWYPKDEWSKINGTWYYFNSSGYLTITWPY